MGVETAGVTADGGNHLTPADGSNHPTSANKGESNKRNPFDDDSGTDDNNNDDLDDDGNDNDDPLDGSDGSELGAQILPTSNSGANGREGSVFGEDVDEDGKEESGARQTESSPAAPDNGTNTDVDLPLDNHANDGLDGSQLGARILLPFNSWDGSVSGEEKEEEGESEARPTEETLPATPDDSSKNTNSDRPLDHHANDGTELPVVGHALVDESKRPEDTVRELSGGGEKGRREARGREDYGFAQDDGDPPADDEIGNLAATAALTPDSVGPVPFSPGFTAPRSRTGSSETPSSWAAGASPTADGVCVGSKASARVGGLLRPLGSRANSDPADVLRLEPLEFDSDEYGA